jgi:non-specific serine/threonine protein kinase/protein-serine/threonine kinase
MASRMTEAVVDLHRQHVIHFDLKPANFLRRESGDFVAIDFGLARHDLLPDLLAEEFTIPMGTFPYMAPEQYLRQRDDLRTDIFTLGAMFYELATGRQPWGDPGSLRGVRKRLWRDPVPPRAIVPGLPEWFQEIVLRCLEVDPKARYQSAGQLLFDLQNPGQVRLTARAAKVRQDGRLAVFRRWRAMRGVKRLSAPISVGAQMEEAPVLMVAVDLSPEAEVLNRLLLTTVRRMLAVQPDARVSCVNILKTARIGLDSVTDDAGDHLHVMRLVALRDWGAELALEEGRISFSVLESSDPAGAIIAHANRNRVDHIIMGARGHSATRRYLGSVSAQVVSEASSSVTVVRVP